MRTAAMVLGITGGVIGVLLGAFVAMMEFRFGESGYDTFLPVLLLGVSVAAIIGGLLTRQSAKQGALTLLIATALGFFFMGGMALVPLGLIFAGGIFGAVEWRRA